MLSPSRSLPPNPAPSPVFRIGRWTNSAAQLLLVVAVILYAATPILKTIDLGWHLAQGRWMVQHGHFYSQDWLNYPNWSHAVIDEYPIFQTVSYAVWQADGETGLVFLNMLVYAVITVLLLRRVWRTPSPLARALATLFIGVTFLFIPLVYRPHVATYLGVIFFGLFLLDHRTSQRVWDFWPLPVYQIIWVNSHGGFVLGPALVALFGCEMTLRAAWQHRAWPWREAKLWLLVLLAIGLACWVNPYGWKRFALPFNQQNSPICMFVQEMQPLSPDAQSVYQSFVLLALMLAGGLLWLQRGALAWSFLILTLLFYIEAQPVLKHWPLFGLFLALTGMSILALAPTSPPSQPKRFSAVFGLGLDTLLVTILALTVYRGLTDLSNRMTPVTQWLEYTRDRCDLPIAAVRWMRENQVQGRLFHRSEYGGLLQWAGYDQGQVYSDTGLGKFENDYSHEICLASERAGFIAHYVQAYRPEYIVCGSFSYNWPYFLLQAGWRPIFYRPNGSVWTRSDLRPDLPTITSEEILKQFNADLLLYGQPADFTLHGHNLVTLHSFGLNEAAAAYLIASRPEEHHDYRYWEAAYLLCFTEPRAPAAVMDRFWAEANVAPAGENLEFRAYADQARGETATALNLLEHSPALGPLSSRLWLELLMEQGRWDAALKLARQKNRFDLRDGRYRIERGECELHFGDLSAAQASLRQALWLYPDDPKVQKICREVADKFDDSKLNGEIIRSQKLYGR